MKSVSYLLACLSLVTVCRSEAAKVLVKEVFFTTDQARENIDSPTVWQSPDGSHLLFATSKEGHSVNVFDAENGAFLRRIGGLGHELGQFNRPNGVWVEDQYLLVVERDNRRVQVLHLPSMVGIATFGEDELIKPYGLYVQPLGGGNYDVFVTDSYESADEEMPADEELDSRVKRYRLETMGATAEAEWLDSFGETAGDGRLFVVESIYGDPQHGRLLIAEELEEGPLGRCLKIYDLEGRFTGETMGKGIFSSQVEGIALYRISDTAGYWIITDQGKVENWFHFFDRESLGYLGSFSGERTLNTDGVWLSQVATQRYAQGLFYACDNDRAIAAFDIGEVLEALSLPAGE